MNEIYHVLLGHARRFEHMQPCDVVKLAYQSTFGPEHMLSDAQKSLEKLRAEMQPLLPDAQPLTEYIGGGFFRLNLRAAKREGLAPQTINALFVSSAAQAEHGELPFAEIRRLAGEGHLPFGQAELERYLGEYCASGCPSVSHSEAYRAAYAPAYRVIRERYVRLLPLLCALDRALAQGTVSLAIDGRCASGKTTLAAFLLQVYPGARVVHMDDFFLPPALRTEQRLAQAGGNVHYERFMEEAGQGVCTGEAFSHRVFDCSVGEFCGQRSFPPSNLTIVEGSYSMRPDLAPLYTASVFVDVAPQLQQERIIHRNGPEAWSVFKDRWIPLEEKYFEQMNVRQRCLFRL